MTPSATSEHAGTSRAGRAERDLSSPEAGLNHLRRLLATGQGESARSFVLDLVARYPDSEAVVHFARVLAPPVTRLVPGRQGRSLDQDYAWLREHAREYPGRWLAVYQNELISAAPELKTVLAQLHAAPRYQEALLHFEPEPGE
jgi:hypothetical protein